jgi:ABC-2 type transport system permease protein
MGSSPAGIVISKALHYIITIAALVFIGFTISFYYGGILFTGESVNFTGAMISAALMSIFFFFSTALSIFLSSLVRKGITAGFISLAVSYVISSISGIESISKFLPYKLVQGANTFSMDGMAFTIIFVLAISIVFIILTIKRMEKVEVI